MPVFALLVLGSGFVFLVRFFTSHDLADDTGELMGARTPNPNPNAERRTRTLNPEPRSSNFEPNREHEPRTEKREARTRLGMHPRCFVSGALHVFDVGPGIQVRLLVGAGLPSQLDDAIAQGAQERAIVGDEQHRPFK